MSDLLDTLYEQAFREANNLLYSPRGRYSSESLRARRMTSEYQQFVAPDDARRMSVEWHLACASPFRTNVMLAHLGLVALRNDHLPGLYWVVPRYRPGHHNEFLSGWQHVARWMPEKRLWRVLEWDDEDDLLLEYEVEVVRRIDEPGVREA